MRVTMRRLAMALMVLAWFAPGAAGAGGGGPICCACIDGDKAHQGVGGPAQAPPGTPALFCASTFNGPPREALAERCDDLNGLLECLFDGRAPCAVELAEADIICPAGTPAAPLLSPLALAGLALALAGVGIGWTRRLGRA
jgi:hypothetical protein